MKVTVTQHYSANETIGCWDIHFANKTSGWAGDGLTKVEGTAIINYKKMIDLLVNDGLVNKVAIESIITYLQYQQFGMTFQSALQSVMKQSMCYISITQKDMDKASSILNGVMEYCESRKQIVVKTSYSFADAFVGGNSSSFNKAKKKVMGELVLKQTDIVYCQLKDYLIARHLI